MKLHRRLLALAIAFATALLVGGCATSRSELRVATPAAAPAAANPNAPLALIRSVKDMRTFEQAPSNPGTPSLGFERADRATADAKLRAVGRKRNTFGQALGDVLLQPGQTVETLLRDHLTVALRDAGYAVRDPAPGESPALVVDVQIRQFWAWVQPGFWALTVHADIATDVQMSTAAAALPVGVQFQDSRQFVTDSAWLEVIDQALQAYRKELAGKLPARP